MLKSKVTLEQDLTPLINLTLYAICMVIVAVIVSAVLKHKVAENNSNILRDDYTAQYNIKQLECLAINIYREAGYEPFEGKVGVAQVTMNRVAHSEFPSDVCQVVYQKNIFYQKVVCQFSWYCDSTHRNRPINPVAYNESYEVAKKVYLENFRLSSLNDALYYHADYVNPRWKLERITQIGAHIFYKEKTDI